MIGAWCSTVKEFLWDTEGIFDNGANAKDKGLTVTEDTVFSTNQP